MCVCLSWSAELFPGALGKGRLEGWAGFLGTAVLRGGVAPLAKKGAVQVAVFCGGQQGARVLLLEWACCMDKGNRNRHTDTEDRRMAAGREGRGAGWNGEATEKHRRAVREQSRGAKPSPGNTVSNSVVTMYQPRWALGMPGIPVESVYLTTVLCP